MMQCVDWETKTREILKILDGLPLKVIELILGRVCSDIALKHSRLVSEEFLRGIITRHSQEFYGDEG